MTEAYARVADRKVPKECATRVLVDEHVVALSGTMRNPAARSLIVKSAGAGREDGVVPPVLERLARWSSHVLEPLAPWSNRKFIIVGWLCGLLVVMPVGYFVGVAPDFDGPSGLRGMLAIAAAWTLAAWWPMAAFIRWIRDDGRG